MSDYRVNLDVFAGPMDLLLYLVRKDEVDIYDIPIASITEQYIKYVEMLKNIDIDLAGDFLVMAASLMAIKSQMLLPKVSSDDIEAEDFDDPRAELICQLLEYKKFKDAANLLDACAVEQKQRQSRPDIIISKLKKSQEPEVDLDNVNVWDLLEAFDTILQATGASFDISHIHDDTPIDLYQIEILHRLQSEGAMPFERIFEDKNNRLVLVGMFLAILELIKDSLITGEQDANGKIHLSALTDEPSEQAVQRAIMASAQQLEKQRLQEQQAEPAVPIIEISEPKKPAEVPEPTAAGEKSVPISELPAKKEVETPVEMPEDVQNDNDTVINN
jgi:segregation and condensation protein A